VAPNSKKSRWRPRRGDESPQRSTVAFTGWEATTVTSELIWQAMTWWKGHGVARSRRTTYTSTMAARPRRRQVDGRQSGHSAPSSSTARSFHQGSLSTRYWAQTVAPARIRACGSPAARYAVSTILFSYCTIGIPFRALDRAKWSALFSNFCVATC
jgi:hypothetical protein